MIRTNLIYGGVILFLTIILGVLMHQNRHFDPDRHLANSIALIHLTNAEASLKREALMLRSNVKQDYDRLTSVARRLGQIRDWFGEEFAVGLSNRSPELGELITRYDTAHNNRVSEVEKFKSRNAVLHNSHGYFTLLLFELAAEIGKSPEHLAFREALAELMAIPARNLRTANQSDRDHVRLAIAKLILFKDSLPRAVHGLLGQLEQHGKIMLEADGDVAESLKLLLLAEPAMIADSLQATYHRFISEEQRRSATYQKSLVLVIAALVLTAALMITKLARSARWLANAKYNRDRLEQEVALRTAELRVSNESLEQSVIESTEAKARAEEASRAKSAFLANMSHELRTPLNAIIGYTEIMLEDAEGENAQERVDDLRKVHRSGRHLLGLIDEILDISKIEAGKFELNFDPVDLANVVSDVENAAAPLMKANNNRLNITAPVTLGLIESDNQRLRQVLLNLLSNAAKFTEEGDIDLTVERTADGWVRFAVRDTGIGMSAEQVELLFEPFVQANSSISQRFGGAGLGLAISRRFVEMMGGRISVASKLDVGSCFTVWLPDLEPSLEARDQQGDGPLVLVIEDTLSDSSLLERLLRQLGYRVEVLRNAETGLGRAREVKPSAIILDIELPGIDGYQALDLLQADETLRSLPVIVSSAHNEARARVIRNGAREFLAKPVNRSALHAAISKHCVPEQSLASSVA